MNDNDPFERWARNRAAADEEREQWAQENPSPERARPPQRERQAGSAINQQRWDNWANALIQNALNKAFDAYTEDLYEAMAFAINTLRSEWESEIELVVSRLGTTKAKGIMEDLRALRKRLEYAAATNEAPSVSPSAADFAALRKELAQLRAFVRENLEGESARNDAGIIRSDDDVDVSRAKQQVAAAKFAATELRAAGKPNGKAEGNA